MSAKAPREQTEIERRLSAHGLIDVCDWGGAFPTQVSGRVPPDGKWFMYSEDEGQASLAIYPAGRYPFALPGSDAKGGWNPMALGDEPEVEWDYGCWTLDAPTDQAERTEMYVVRLVELWRSGEPPNDF